MRSGESSFGHILSKVNLLLDELASTDLNIGVIHQNELASKFINIFDFLFKDSENPDNLFKQIQESGNKEHTQTYLEKISQLKKIIDKLPEDSKYKKLLLNKLNDNCNLYWINKYNRQKYKLDDAHKFIRQTLNEDIINTVIVKTWGTQSELSSGLKNVVQQKLRGDDVGHVSLLMRVKADEEGLRLVKKYCLGEGGLKRIPYEIKNYGNQAVYEIYWSYWPNRLNTIKKDIELERNFQFKLNDQIIQEMPEELRSLILLERYRQNKKIVLAPAATDNLYAIESDIDRRNYLTLKKRKYELNEELDALQVLISNYLNTEGGKKKKPSDNFFVLLERFKYQFSINAQQIIHQVITKRNTTSEQSELILNAANELITKKRELSQLIKVQIEASANKIQFAHKEIKELKGEAKSHQIVLQQYDKKIKKLTEIASALSIGITAYQGCNRVRLSPIVLDIINKYSERIPKLTNINIDYQDQTISFEEAQMAAGVFAKNLAGINTKRVTVVQKIANCMDSLHKLTLDRRVVITNQIVHKEMLLDEMRSEIAKIDRYQAKLTEFIVAATETHEITFNGYNQTENKRNTITAEYSSQEEAMRIYKRIEFYCKKLLQRKEIVQEDIKIITKSDDYTPDEKEEITHKKSHALEKIQSELIDAQHHLNDLQKYINAMKMEPLNLAEFDDTKKCGETDKIYSNVSEAQSLRSELSARKIQLLIGKALLDGEIKTALINYNDPALNIEDNLLNIQTKMRSTEGSLLIINQFISDVAQPLSRRTEHEITFIEIDPATLEERNITQKYLTNEEALSIKERLESYHHYLNSTRKNLIAEKNIFKRLESTYTAEHFVEKSIYRGFPRQDVVLKKFDIESMLAVARNLAETVDRFDLITENCSTTCMKILNAGAPSDVKPLFIWSHAEDGSKIPTNAFITNPQQVYTSARVADDFDRNIPTARQYIEQQQQPLVKKDKDYIFLLNTLAMEDTTELVEKTRSTLFIIRLLFKFFYFIAQVWRDYHPPSDLQPPRNTGRYFEKIVGEVKNKQTKSYDLIRAKNTSTALVLMQNMLQYNKHAIPFFDKKTLGIIEVDIIFLQSKKDITPDEKDTVENYFEIIKERNARIDCVKEAIASGKKPQNELDKRAIDFHPKVTKEAFAEQIVTQFIQNYNDFRNKGGKLKLFMTNFVSHIPNEKLFEDQLKFIHQYVKTHPKSRSAMSWKQIVITQEMLDKLGMESLDSDDKAQPVTSTSSSDSIASFTVSAKPLPPTSRGSSAGSNNLGASLYPAHKARDVGEVILAETMNEADSILTVTI